MNSDSDMNSSFSVHSESGRTLRIPAVVFAVKTFRQKVNKSRRERKWMGSSTHSIIVTVMLSIFVAGSIASFSASGWGIDFALFSKTYQKYRHFGFIPAGGLIFMLHLLDASTWNWKGSQITFRVVLLLVVLCLLNGLILSFKNFPSAGLFISVMGVPVFSTLVHYCMSKVPWFPESSYTRFAKFCVKPLAVLSFLCMAWWIVWVCIPPFGVEYATDHWWSEKTQAEYATHLLCDRFADKNGAALSETDYEWYKGRVDNDKQINGNIIACFIGFNKTTGENYDILGDDTTDAVEYACDTCIQAFNLWVQPAILSIALAAYTALAYFLGSGESIPNKFKSILGVIAMAIWVAAGLGGVGGNVSSSIFVSIGAGCIAIAACDLYTHGFDGLRQHIEEMEHEMEHKIAGYEDVVRGVAVWAISPIVLVYIVVEVLHQGTRLCTRSLCFNKKINPSEAPTSGGTAVWITEEAHMHLEAMKKWNWTRVLNFGCYFGIGYLIMQVAVGKLTNVLLSVLIVSFDDFSVINSTAILVAVGVSMFLCPVIPGVPVYLTSGILLTATCKSSMGDLGAMAYAVLVSLVLKLIASMTQQKGIGEQLSTSLSVKQAVGVNSRPILAMRLILQDPGLSVAKATVLSIGPDWPISVLCGILRLPVLPIIIGTIPVLVLIIPTVFAGGYMYLAADDNATDTEITLAATFTAIFGMVCLLCSAVMVVCVNNVVSSRGDEIDNLELDEDVKKADAEGLSRAKDAVEAVNWPRVPLQWRLVLHTSMLCFSSVTYIITYDTAACFKEFGLLDTVEEKLQGNFFNIIKPWGYVCLGVYFVACALFVAFHKCYANQAIESYIKEKGSASDIIEGHDKSKKDQKQGGETAKSEIDVTTTKNIMTVETEKTHELP